MSVKPKNSRALFGVVASSAFEYSASIMNNMCADMNLGISPVNERTVHPNLASSETHGWSLASLVFSAKRAPISASM
jgi:hypothetical protein